MNNYLLPCALCGCTKVPRRQGNGIGNNWIECVECGMSTRLREDGAGSEKDWNRRPALAASAPTPSAEPAAIWKAITEEAECVVQRGTKYLMLTEEMCVRLGTAIENIPDLESVQNEYYGRGQEIGYREGIAAASRSAAPLANPSDKQEAKYVETQPGSPNFDGAEAYEAYLNAQSAEQDRIDAERWRMAILYEYVTDFEVLGIDQRIAIDKGASK